LAPIYCFHLFATSLSDISQEKLLRLRKDLPTTVPVKLAQVEWQKHIPPLFSHESLVNQSLVELRPGKIIPRLNSELVSWEANPALGAHENGFLGSRPTKRRGTYLADDDYGLLVTDMTPSISFLATMC
jgi:inositol-pentakisphosphate 2-kinase